jgi:hypothetical protein
MLKSLIEIIASKEKEKVNRDQRRQKTQLLIDHFIEELFIDNFLNWWTIDENITIVYNQIGQTRNSNDMKCRM